MIVFSLGLDGNYVILPLILFSFFVNSHFQNQKGKKKKKMEEVTLICARRIWEEVQLPKVFATKWRA